MEKEKTSPNEQAFSAIHNSGGFGGGNFFRSIFRIAGIREPPSIVCTLKQQQQQQTNNTCKSNMIKK